MATRTPQASHDSLWQTTDGQQRITWEAHAGWVRSIVFSSDWH
ncbi:MAG TPA: hypothetical protein VE944_27700 [Nostoc sp.]|nr:MULTISPECIES: hypothetical protein [unclassified Nostoc]HYX18081.1 hypothetical protein [Nostoc sp.]